MTIQGRAPKVLMERKWSLIFLRETTAHLHVTMSMYPASGSTRSDWRNVSQCISW